MTQLSVPRFMSVGTFQALSSPADGDMVSIQIDAVNSINWAFRFNSSSASIFKWEALSHLAPYMATVDTDEINGSATNSVFYDLPSAGPGTPSLTVPLSGDYDCGFFAKTYGGSGGMNEVAMKFGSAAISGDNGAAAFFSVAGPTSTHPLTIYRSNKRKTGLATGDVIKLMYLSTNNASSARFLQRSLWIQPVRVSTT